MASTPTPAQPLSPKQTDFFRRNGYVVLPNHITPAQLASMKTLLDRDRADYEYLWRPFGPHQTLNCDPLVSSPDVDQVIRHPTLLPAVETLMGGPVCFSEVCLRHMAPLGGEARQAWHRDRPHWAEHPFRMDYIQLMIYLTDVGPGTHCFSISPEAVDQPILDDNQKQLARGGSVDIHGPAGTAVLFNVSVLHTATARKTEVERKTIQIYYGHRDRAPLSNDSFIPPRLFRDHPDPEVRAFYGNLNGKTRLFLESCGLAPA